MEAEIRVHLILRRGDDERIECSLDLLGTCRVHPRRRQCGCLAFDSEPEVDHVEDVVVGPDGGGLDGERRRLGHREHERATAVERFDQTFSPQPRHRLTHHRPRDPVLIDELGLRGQLVAR